MKNRNTYQSSTSQSCSVLLPVGRTSQLLQETNGKSPTMINISKVVLVKKKKKKKKKKMETANVLGRVAWNSSPAVFEILQFTVKFLLI